MIKFEQEDQLLGRNQSLGNAATKALVSSGSDNISHADNFIREVLQNCCDASRTDTDYVHVRIHCKQLDNQEEKLYREQLAIDSHIEPRVGNKIPNFPYGAPLGTVLFIEDFSTVGLTECSDNHPNESRFFKFFFDSGGNDESVDTGGSFGYGKAVYSDNSKTRTLIAYSCCNENGITVKKIFGITRTQKYFYEGEAYAGFIYHGALNGLKEGERSQAIYGAEADELASYLGFNLRDDSQTGTSIAIIGLNAEPHEFVREIKKSTEIYWWKKIIDNHLFVEFSVDDKDYGSADPFSQPGLAPFIDCYELIQGKREKPESGDGKFLVGSLNRRQRDIGISPGKLALIEVVAGTEEKPDPTDHLVNSVALFRSSGMVVEYRKPIGSIDSGSFICGVFLADDRLNKLLRSSEPASHWGWNDSSPRIEELGAYKELEIDLATAIQIIRHIKNSVNQKFSNFKDSLQDSSKVTSASFRSLDRLLTKVFGKGKAAGKPPFSNKRLVSIRNPSPARLIEGTHPPQYECEVEIALDSDAPEDSKDLVVRHVIQILGDDAATAVIDRFDSEVISTDASYVGQSSNGHGSIYAISKDPVKFLFKTKPVPTRFHRETETIVKEDS